MVEQREWPKFMIRLPPDMKEWVSQEAMRNCGSQNSEIIRALVERRERVTAERASNGANPPSPQQTAALPGGNPSHPG